MSTHIETVALVAEQKESPVVHRSFWQEAKELIKPLLLLIAAIGLIASVGTAVVMSMLHYAS